MVQADPANQLLQAQQYYQQAEYKQAIAVLKQALTVTESAELHYWLGKAYGREAEQANPLRAFGLAKKSREQFEQAVQLEPDYVAAWQALFDFYYQAPAIVGGGRDKAVNAAAQLNALDPVLGKQANEKLACIATTKCATICCD